MDWEQIFVVGAEGGCLTVMGCQSQDGEWSLLLVRDEATMKAFADDLADDELYERCSASTWEELLDKIDVYPWAMLYPVDPVHSLFRQRVWNAVVERTADCRGQEEWLSQCGVFT